MPMRRQPWRNRFLHWLRHVLLERRARLIASMMDPQPGLSVLDLGGGRGDLVLLLKGMGVEGDFTVADIYSGAPPTLTEHPDVHFAVIKEDEALPFANRQFDLVICNAVIEHVTLSKAECGFTGMTETQWREASFQHQRAFADEIRRVSNAYFVQTPHRDFPIDCHMWLPFTNWMPHSALIRMVYWTDRFWIKPNWGLVDWNLLRTTHMQAMFPDADLFIERWLGLPKAIIACRRLE